MRSVVEEYWRLMASNDFWSVGAVLADDFILEWPQSNERIRGREKLAQMNAEYPSHGPWRFTINRVVAGVDEVVTDVSVTDGAQRARAISFFTIRDGKIVKIIEYWPEPFEAPENRRHLADRIEEQGPGHS